MVSNLVSGRTNVVTPTAPANTANSAYSTGQALGIAFAISGATAPGRGRGLLQDITVVDASGQNVPIDFFFFDQAPVTGTDNSAYTLNAADYAHLVGIVSLTTYATTGGAGIGILNNIALPIRCADGKTLYCQLVVRGAPTYTSTTALTLTFGFLQD